MATNAYGFDDKKLKVSIDKAIEDAIKDIDISKIVGDIWKTVYPIGSIYISTVQTNPAVIFGGGEWISFGIGKTLVGVDGSDSDFSSAEKTGGSKDIPKHSHTQNAKFEIRPGNYASVYTESGWNTSISKGSTWNADLDMTSASHKGDRVTIAGETGTTGTGKNNMPPYITVYMYKRIA